MNNIIVAIDFSEITCHIVEQAAIQAEFYNARIYLIHVAAPDPDFIGLDVGPKTVRTATANELQNEKTKLEQIAEELKESGHDAIALIIQGPTAQTLLQESKKLNPVLLVMGTHGKGITKTLLLGSTSQAVIQGASCPVLLIPYNADLQKTDAQS